MRVGHLGDVGHQEVHERRVEQLPGLVVGHPLVERAADALRDAAVDLALDDHRVDQVAAVVHHGVLEDRDLGGLRVGLDDHRVHAGGERRALGRVEVACPPGPARRPRRPAACRGRRRRTGWPPWTPRRRRSAAGWTAPRPCRGRSTASACPCTDTTPSTISRSSADASSASAAIRSAFSLARFAARWIAEPLITAAREANVPTAYGIRRVSPVTTSTSSKRHAELVGDDLRERPSAWPWPCVVRPVATLTLPEVSTCTCAPS